MKRALLLVASALVTLAAIEAVAWIGLRIVGGEWIGHAGLDVERAARAAGVLGGAAPEEIRRRGELAVQRALHPYLGWVKDADAPDAASGNAHPEAREYGFPDNPGPIFHAQDPDRLIVVVLGGSVANDFVRKAGAELEAGLARVPRFRDREVVIVSLALPGYKQPQQLMALSYFLALGAHFDVVIEIDGYNELVASAHNALAQGVFPAYPKRWYERVADLDADLRLAVGEVAFVQSLRRERSLWFSRAPLRWSLAAGLVWKLLDRDLEHRVAGAQARAGEGDPSSYQVRGPRREPTSERALLEEIAALWRRSSRQMQQLARARGAEYHHFLQPNQYVADGKSFTTAELEKALQRGTRREAWVRDGYPALQREGRALAGEGVSFHDLSPLFRDVASTVYIDVCCHMNRFGNRLMADAITRVLGAEPEGEARADHTPPGGA